MRYFIPFIRRAGLTLLWTIELLPLWTWKLRMSVLEHFSDQMTGRRKRVLWEELLKWKILLMCKKKTPVQKIVWNDETNNAVLIIRRIYNVLWQQDLVSDF